MRRSSLLWLVFLIFLLLPLSAGADELRDIPKAEQDVSNIERDTSKTEQDTLKGETEGSAAVNAAPAESAETQEAVEEEFVEVKPMADPLEPLNRLFYFVNDKLYFIIFKPVAQLYSLVVPEFGRVRIRNAFHNMTAPVRIVNSLLQLKMKDAGVELARFLINSSVGLAGMFDVASQNPDLKGSDKDLGQTLGVYGVGEGIFLMLPILGPSSLRDSVGMAGDTFLNPITYIKPTGTSLAVRALEYENALSLRIGEYEDLKESAVDPYTSLKDAYTEYRRNKIKQEKPAPAPALVPAP
ncbi:MAG TPA: VacJ family lipoprotein [Thermodesulfovibrionales bacterium]|nr:VacJ family lipoprotein [Thermodesulfovibrionales bacterium]